MSEHPILFQPWKVRRILEWDFAAAGDMQTRRVVKPQPAFAERPRWSFGDGHSGIGWYCCEDDYSEEGSVFWRCSYGQPGDLLVPLTTWAVHRRYDHLKPLELPRKPVLWSYWESNKKPARFGRLRPGRFLPSRFRHLLPRLVNNGVSVERVWEISVEDVKAEGIWWADILWPDINANSKFQPRFAKVWDTINAKPKPAMHNPYTNAKEKCQVAYPWDDVTEVTTISRKASPWHNCKVYIVGNPWVWPVRFARVKEKE